MTETLYVRCKDHKNRIIMEPVQGTRFTVRGFEFMDLFFYRHDGNTNLVMNKYTGSMVFASEAVGKYLVAEARTGLFIPAIYENACESMTGTEELLLLKGVEWCRKYMEELLKQHCGK